MAVIRLIILMLLLFYGAYVTHVAQKEVRVNRLNKMKTEQLKRELTEGDFGFMKMVLNEGKPGRAHDHFNSSNCIIVKNGKIIGTAWDQSTSPTDPTAHAEMEAVKEACNYLGNTSLDGCVVYSMTQPCPMCLSLFYLTKVEKIIYFKDSDIAGRNDDQLLNQQVYKSLIKDRSERIIPEVVLLADDLNGLFLSN